MRQYLGLLKEIKEKGTYKPAARPGMPGTQSLFGYQFRHDLSASFPLLTTKRISFKNIVIELLWFLRGDTNIKYLVDNDCNIWNGDAYNYYCKKVMDIIKYGGTVIKPYNFKEFINLIKENELKEGSYTVIPNYTLGDCGFQYGRVWRDWSRFDGNMGNAIYMTHIDQIKNLIEGLLKTPESRRHIVTAIDPAHDQDLALYWCHALFQFNCRPLSFKELWNSVEAGYDQRSGYFGAMAEDIKDMDDLKAVCINQKVPLYYLDCQLYQRSADSILGVPYNIASYALLTNIIAEVCNMIPGEFIHSFGDVHIYDNHKEAVEEQLTREPKELPKLAFSDEFHYLCKELEEGPVLDIETFFQELKPEMFKVLGYDPYSSIKAELSTGTV